MSDQTPVSETSLESLSQRLEEAVTLKDRKYRLSTYKKCFLGTEAVDELIKNEMAATRIDAVDIGQLLLDAGYINHVTRDHDFKDKDLYYRFTAHEDHGATKGSAEEKEKGQSGTWAKFLGSGYNTRDISLQAELPEYEAYVGDRHPPEAVNVNVTPLDEHNVRLLDNVKPTDWKNPSAKKHYNLVAIGAGAGGLVSSSIAAGLGGTVALIEKHLLGGDCLNVGCVPSKALIRSAHTIKAIKTCNEFGVKVNGSVDVDFPGIMQRMRRLRADISPNDSADNYSKTKGVDVFQGEAKFVSPNQVEVDGQVLKFSRCVIASGGRPAVPPIPGIDSVPYITNESLFNLTELPKRFGVIGAGPIGLEMAQSFAIFGSEVHVFLRRGDILAKEDPEAARIVEKELVNDGIVFEKHTKYEKIEKGEDGSIKVFYSTKGEDGTKVLEVDQLLVSAGRAPNVQGLDLEKADVVYDGKAGIQVNDYLQTSNSKIYAVGDCCTKYQFTHVADFMARLAVRNMFFFGRGKFSNLIIPWATYTSPEIAHVGLYEADAQKRGIKYKVYMKEFEDNDRAILDGNLAKTGFVKIMCKGSTDEIIGATVVAEHAGEMISELTVAMQHKVKLGQIANVIHPYPTQAEAIRQAGDLFNKTRLTPTVKALLRNILRRR